MKKKSWSLVIAPLIMFFFTGYKSPVMAALVLYAKGSASSERGFSVGISRISLNPETVEALVCLRSWYKAGLIEEKDDHEFIRDI